MQPDGLQSSYIMQYKRLLASFLAASALVSLLWLTALAASDDEYFSENDVRLIRASNGSSVSGSGTTNTHEQVQQKTEEELAKETLEELFRVQNGILEDGTSNEGLDGSNIFSDAPDLMTPEEIDQIADDFTANFGWDDIAPAPTQPTAPSVTEPVPIAPATPQAPATSTYTIRMNDGSFAVVQEFSVDLDFLRSIIPLVSKLAARYNIPEQELIALFLGIPGSTADQAAGSLQGNAGAMNQYVADTNSYFMPLNPGTVGGVGGVPSPELPELINPVLEDLLGGTTEELVIGNYHLQKPLRNDVLAEALASYVALLNEHDAATLQVRKFTVYTADSYRMQTIRYMSPTYPLHYRWVVENAARNCIVDDVRTQPYIPIMFQSPGTYYVSVYQNKDVTRNNKISGYKTEIWTLANGDAFDGLIFYAHTTTFESFISADVGPTVEELKMTGEDFTATVTPSMAQEIQFIDSSGYIHQAGGDFSTERIG